MNQVISLILFTIPGLLTYFWINLFGVTSTTKQNNKEVSAISILLWIPILCVVLIIYNFLALTTRWKEIHPNYNIPILKRDWRYIDSLVDLTALSSNIWFILFYLLLTIIISFYLGKVISKYGYKRIIDKVNDIRRNNNIAPLGLHSTVWDSIFLGNDGQIIEYRNQGESIKGHLIKVPRSHEEKKAIGLEAVDHWGRVMEYYDVEIELTYVDTENGIIINVYNFERALEAQDIFNDRFPDGITDDTPQNVIIDDQLTDG
ncbi:hypothetical protein NVV31_22625 [Cytobacillus firmus]|uniref:hypothetical protein n=1 Tax=Cytobacillus firmus TaxID=1399 RepID=UPI0021C79078|nr:hypothetical protein [Cytobacillus firmus]MCU1808170.1 hypothetical protein [Cytobacillus firmus]